MKDNKINVDEFRKSRMDEKVILLKDYLPEFLSKNKSIYSILSVGVHSLSENDCLMYFDSIKTAIELILDEKLEKIQKQIKLDEANKKIDAINQSLKAKIKS